MTGGNRNDITQLIPLIEAIPPVRGRRGRPRQRPVKVLATNVRTGKTQREPVAAVLVHYDTNRYDLTIKNGNRAAVIQTTSSHLFWETTSHRWVKAAALIPGDELRTLNGTGVTIAHGLIPRARSGSMWDLTVTGDHDFYIETIAASVLVHNCPVPGGSMSSADIGKAGVERTANEIEQANGRVLGSEITIRAAGWRAKVDLYVQLPNGQKAFIEVKTGEGAGLSEPQKAVYPELVANGGVPAGSKAAQAGLTPGVPIGPTQVWIVHQPWPLGELP